MDKILQAKWTSPSGKYWVELYTDRYGATYQSDNGGGNLGNITVIEAIDRMEARIKQGEFNTDKAKRPLQRIYRDDE